MEHAKKMILVDSRVLNQTKEKDVYEHEKLLEKKHPRPVEKKVTSATNLDIERILEVLWVTNRRWKCIQLL